MPFVTRGKRVTALSSSSTTGDGPSAVGVLVRVPDRGSRTGALLTTRVRARNASGSAARHRSASARTVVVHNADTTSRRSERGERNSTVYTYGNGSRAATSDTHRSSSTMAPSASSTNSTTAPHAAQYARATSTAPSRPSAARTMTVSRSSTNQTRKRPPAPSGPSTPVDSNAPTSTKSHERGTCGTRSVMAHRCTLAPAPTRSGANTLISVGGGSAEAAAPVGHSPRHLADRDRAAVRPPIRGR